MTATMRLCAGVTTQNPKRDSQILRMLHRGLAAKEVAFKMKLTSTSVVYEVLRKNNIKACGFRRRNACKRLPKTIP